MKARENKIVDTSGRFKTDKNFKNTILKNCSRLRQKSTDAHYSNRNNTIQPKLNNIRRITNYKNVNNLNENYLRSNIINNRSKDNISIEINNNSLEAKRKKNIRACIKKAFFMEFNNKTKENNEINEKNNNLDKKEKHDELNEVNKNKINEKNIIQKNEHENKENAINENKNIENNEKRRNRLQVKNNHNTIKSESNEGIQELIINMKENNFIKEDIKRSNSIRRIMNSLYYHSYTAEKKDKNRVIDEKKIINVEENEKNNFDNIKEHIKNHNSVFNNNIYNESKNIKKHINYNSNSSYIYKKKNKQFGNIPNSNNNFVFNTYSTEDNSFITNENNKEYVKKNSENLNQNLIKVKIIYQKPRKRPQITKENTITNNTVSINPEMNRFVRRRKLYLEKKASEDLDAKRSNSKGKSLKENCITPIFRYSKGKEKKIVINSNDDINKKSDNKNFNYNNNNNLIIEFFDDIIELCNGIEEKTIFEILTKNINNKYIIDYEKDIYEQTLNEINEDFDYCYKYFCIIFTSLYFLSKDEILYKNNSIKIHLLFIQYIYSSLCYIGYENLNSKNIKRFFKDYHFKKKVSIIQCTTSIIKLLFDEKEEYNSLNNALKQLMVNARTTKVLDITKIINQTILFCFNTKLKVQNPFPYLKQRNSAINNIYNNYISNKEIDNNMEEKYPGVPYIKTIMRKKFCLVLDLDETISHSLKLSFGYYFLLRPGVIEFLTELSELYEIIIFTSSPKIYADNIIDKIDEKGILISHRLYKPHVVFEKGKSVKKLNLIGRDLNKIIFVDNMKSNAKYNPQNLYLIPTWTDDIYDDELFKLKKKLKYIYNSGKFNDDITKAL